MYLIVGLGNPGKEYENTRHNIGFMVIDRLSKDMDIPVNKDKCQALIGQGKINGCPVLLAKPQTFMNMSGISVVSLLKWFKIDTNKLILISDDLDLDVGVIRIRTSGNSGGHKGVESVISSLKEKEFARIRIGIGRGLIEMDSAAYVLSVISKKDRAYLDLAAIKVAEAVEVIVNKDIDEAMNQFNSGNTNK